MFVLGCTGLVLVSNRGRAVGSDHEDVVGCRVTWFCYHLIAKPGNMTATSSWRVRTMKHCRPQSKLGTVTIKSHECYPSMWLIFAIKYWGSGLGIIGVGVVVDGNILKISTFYKDKLIFRCTDKIFLYISSTVEFYTNYHLANCEFYNAITLKARCFDS